jgi:hypothetical protein
MNFIKKNDGVEIKTNNVGIDMPDDNKREFIFANQSD